MAKLWITQYEVWGDGPFPTDMLRYDASYPSHTEDAQAILAEAGFGMRPLKVVPRRVRLTHRDTHSGWSPTADRWSSFLWTVDPESVRSWSA